MFSISASLAAVFGLLSLAAGQGQPVPVQSGAGDNGDSGCGGCYIVANVAGIAFGSETLTATQTNSVIMGRNGSYTTTSVVFDVGAFTGASGSAVAGGNGGAQTAYNTEGTTVVLGGVTLTSPTAYNVFTAYAVTSSVFTNGACVAMFGTTATVSPAFSVPIPEGVNQDNFASFQFSAEQAFISQLGAQTCVPGGENYAPTSQIPVVVTTTTVTNSAAPAMVPTPASVGTSASGPTAVATGTTSFVAFPTIASAASTIYVPSGVSAVTFSNGSYAGAPSISIHEAGANRQSVIGSLFAGAVALVAGFAA